MSKSTVKSIQIYLKKVKGGGGAISASIAVATAGGILLKFNHSMLTEFSGPVQLAELGPTHC